MKKILIVGLGIGEVYKEQCELRGYKVITVDKNKPADFDSLDKCLAHNRDFDLSILCIPNFLHKPFAEKLLSKSKAIIIEKPGLETKHDFHELFRNEYNTEIYIAKNNLYRNQIDVLSSFNPETIKDVHITWLNGNRIPMPGGWFTNKKLSWGGVGRDLLPHLLHFAHGLFNHDNIKLKDFKLIQQYKLEDCDSTEYGNVEVTNPVYDVDDYAMATFTHRKSGFQITLNCCWKNYHNIDKRKIIINFTDGTRHVFDFGLCPNKYYGLMIDDILSGKNRIKHADIDYWVHEIIDKIYERS